MYRLTREGTLADLLSSELRTAFAYCSSVPSGRELKSSDVSRSFERTSVCGLGDGCPADAQTFSSTIIGLRGDKPVALQLLLMLLDDNAIERALMYVSVYSTCCMRPGSSREAASVSAARDRFSGPKTLMLSG